MKKLLVFAISIYTVYSIKAQSPIEVGQSQINGGFGFSNYGLPVYVGFDYGFKEDITLGAEASYRTYRDNIFGTKYKHTIMGFCANANYHFNTLLDLTPEYDVYGGLNIGFFTWSSSNNYPGSGASGLGLGLQIGGRYYFNDNLGVNLEFAGGNASSGGKFGISYLF
ncbi:MAG: hypothetical protein H6586_06835 [Flavobacteriales bacterium]|nr:hypothetical protein [Flavobacteriales bacterium]